MRKKNQNKGYANDVLFFFYFYIDFIPTPKLILILI